MKIFRKETLHLLLGSLMTVAFVALLSLPANASSIPSVECKTNFGEKEFTLEDNTIAFHTVDEGASRSISSIYEARIQKTHKGVKRSLYLNGNKHLVSIKDINNMNSDDDFLAITSPEGHKMTYPIICSRK